MTNHNSQRARILKRLLRHDEVPAPTLHRIGSGKPHGYVASMTRRISEIRDQGYTVTCRKEQHKGQTRTFYTLAKPS